MQAELIKTREGDAIIKWQDGDEFGEISFEWNYGTCKFSVDSELLGIESIIKIIKSIK